MIDGCHIPDRQDNMIDHEVFTYSILFVGQTGFEGALFLLAWHKMRLKEW
jgi:hypothetical protein